MTGYQEILTDPSYAGQIITFTFPHIGNVGTNDEDIETVNMAATPGARGVVLHTDDHRAVELPRDAPSRPVAEGARHRSASSGIDTRALTSLIREKGMPNAVIAHAPDGKFDLDALKKEARDWPGLVGMDLVPMVTSGPALHLGRDAVGVGQGLRPAGRSRVPRGRDRLRHQAQHPAAARRQRLQGDGGAGHDLGRGHPGAQARRRVPLQRPGRSGGDRRIRGAGDPEHHRQRHARPSASASATRCSASRSAARP